MFQFTNVYVSFLYLLPKFWMGLDNNLLSLDSQKALRAHQKNVNIKVQGGDWHEALYATIYRILCYLKWRELQLYGA